jgi:hypothetical protein
MEAVTYGIFMAGILANRCALCTVFGILMGRVFMASDFWFGRIGKVVRGLLRFSALFETVGTR